MKASNPGSVPEVLHYVGYDVDRGGIISVVRSLAGEAEFRCVIGANRGFRQLRAPPLDVAEFTPIDGETLGLAALFAARRVASEARAWLAADCRRVFHGHSRAGLAVALWLAEFGERRVVASVHCYGRHRWFYRWAKRRMGKRLFWLSPAMKAFYGSGDASWDGCIPGCVPESFFSLSPSPSLPGKLRIGGIGALVRWKRWDLVLRAIAALPADLRRRVRFPHIGPDGDDTGYSASLRAMARDAGLADTVLWAGEQPGSASLLGEIDALVVASDNEPFSVAMLEALAAGVPVIASDSGGARDAVTDGAGKLFRSGDPADLSRMISELAGGPSPVPRGDGRAAMRFSASAVASEWLCVYRGLLGSD